MKVGVIIPTCNRPLLLPRAVASVLNQTVLPDEIIIVNDGWEPVQPFQPGSRVKVIDTKGPRGLPFARAAGIRALSTDIDVVCYVDDDDEMLPEHIQLLSEQIKEGKHFAFSIGLHRYANGFETTDPEPNNTGPKRYYDPLALLKQNIAPPSCFMHTMEAYREVGGWDAECLRIEDWDLWGRMFIRYGPPGKVDEVTTIIYKGHGTNLTDSNRYNYSMACSWRDIVEDRLKYMASQNRYKISNDDRERFCIPKIGIPMAPLDPSELPEILDSIIMQQGVDFEVLLTIPECGEVTHVAWKYSKYKRIRIFPIPLSHNWINIQMINWSMLVSRSEYLAWIDVPLTNEHVLKSRSLFLDNHRRIGILRGSPIMLRRRVIETVGGLETTFEDLLKKASSDFKEQSI